MSANEQTREFHDFERLAINLASGEPGVYDTERLLPAFRAGNIVLAERIMDGKYEASDIETRGIGRSVDIIGEALRLSRPPESKKKR